MKKQTWIIIGCIVGAAILLGAIGFLVGVKKASNETVTAETTEVPIPPVPPAPSETAFAPTSTTQASVSVDKKIESVDLIKYSQDHYGYDVSLNRIIDKSYLDINNDNQEEVIFGIDGGGNSGTNTLAAIGYKDNMLIELQIVTGENISYALSGPQVTVTFTDPNSAENIGRPRADYQKMTRILQFD